MNDAALADLEHANLVTAIGAAASQVPGARIERIGGVALIASGHPLRLFNQVLIVDPAATADDLAAAVAITRERGDAFVVNLRRGTDDRFAPAVAELGLIPVSARPWMPGMAIRPLPATGSVAPPAPGFEIRRAADAQGVADHVRAAADGFEMPIEWLEAVVTGALLDRADAALYVGYADGVPVTTGLGIRTGDTTGVYNIATVPAARRRGHGAAMTMRIVDDGAAAGCDVAVLQASEMGYSIYERLGFRTVVEYEGYVVPE